MFSGKSEELIRRLRRAMIARKRVQAFKPAVDTRYAEDEIVSHSDSRLKAEVVSSAREILERMDWRTQVAGIDESNFFGNELVDVASRLADSGKQVIIGGLDTDYMGRPFHPMPDLLCSGGVDYEDAGHLYALRESGQAYAASGGKRRSYRGGGGRGL